MQKIPDRIKIERVKEYYTEDIGVYGNSEKGGQFMALIVATLPGGHLKDWKHHKRWYAILHLFNRGGAHIETRHHFTGMEADGHAKVTDSARDILSVWLAEMPDVKYCDISIGLFRTEIDGEIFGLIDTSDEMSVTATLVPNDFVFYPPWDGTYDT